MEMHLDKLSLEDIQHEMLGVLEQFHELCERNNLQYVLAYGTLIGAIRHNGFIPWDDDVDVWMPRADYDRLHDMYENKSEHLAPYKLCTQCNTLGYPFYIPRFSNMKFRFISETPGVEDFDIGVFLDIYPIDDFAISIKKTEKCAKKIDKRNKIYAVYASKNEYSNAISSSIRKVISSVLHFFYGENFSKINLKKIKKIMNKYTTPNSEYVGVICWGDSPVAHKRKDIFSDGKMIRSVHEFQGKLFYVPKNYDQILRNSYGDYMKLPPIEQRNAYHGYSIEVRKG